MINIIGTIYDNSSQHVVAQADQILDTSYKNGTKQHLINAELKQRLDDINTVLSTDAEELSRKLTEIDEFLDSIEGTDLGNIINGVHHRILSASEYEALNSYDNNTLYFVTEHAIDNNEYGHNQFGGTFPMTFN